MVDRSRPPVLVVGGGPAGLAAAETLAKAGEPVVIAERLASLGRKFLMAGRGGLNLTHSETLETFLTRYEPAEPLLLDAIRAFPPLDAVGWSHGLGQETFVGSSGRIFPRAMKASPLLRAWLGRLADLGVRVETRTTWRGWDPDGRPLLEDASGTIAARDARATLLALGGASWPRLGSDGKWTAAFRAAGLELRPLRPANAGLYISWSPILLQKYEGAAIKRIAVSHGGLTRRGEAIITRTGLEGGVVYALSSRIGQELDAGRAATISIDLIPDLSLDEIARRLAAAGPRDSLANVLRKTLRLAPAAAALLREHRPELPRDPALLAARIKAVPLSVHGIAGLERAISSAGGVPFTALDENFMLRDRPGTFVAGEMLDWDAPTGGYLLQASISTGIAAARGILRHLEMAARTLSAR